MAVSALYALAFCSLLAFRSLELGLVLLEEVVDLDLRLLAPLSLLLVFLLLLT